MKVSEICKLIEESLRLGRYPLDSDVQKRLAHQVQVQNLSGSEDLHSDELKIEVRIDPLYSVNNYVQGIEHLPGILEVDALDSYKMICRRFERMKPGVQIKGL